MAGSTSEERPARQRRRSSTSSTTLADVAAIAGVSAQTVSRVLRDTPDVSEDTRIRVEAAVRKSGYVPNLAARNLASNRSQLVATVVPSISTSIFADTLTAANDVLAPNGYQLILGFSDYDSDREERLLRELLGRRPDGVFLVGVMHTPGAHDLLRAASIPVVETWGWTDQPIDDLVGFSNADAMSNLTDVVHAKGYRKMVIAGSATVGDHRSRERLEGFRRAHQRLFPGEELRFVDASELPLTLESGAKLLTEVLQRFPDADLALFSTDILASGALLAAQRRGMAIPSELAITGFGDFELSAALTPPLSTVSVPSKEIGRLGAERLLEKMEGRATGRVSISLEAPVRLRGTT